METEDGSIHPQIMLHSSSVWSLGFHLSPLHSYGNRNLFLWNTDRNNANCFGVFLWWKKPKQAKVKPNQRCSAGKTSGNARKSDCSYRVLCVLRLPRQRQLSSICRIFQFWGKLDFKQVPISCRCILKIGLMLPVPPIKESIRSSQWNWFFISQVSESIIIAALLGW